MEENPKEEMSGLHFFPTIVIFAIMIVVLIWVIPEAAKQDAMKAKPAVEASLTP